MAKTIALPKCFRSTTVCMSRGSPPCVLLTRRAPWENGPVLPLGLATLPGWGGGGAVAPPSASTALSQKNVVQTAPVGNKKTLSLSHCFSPENSRKGEKQDCVSARRKKGTTKQNTA